MKILYYDCFAGISGDMNLAALIDLGVDTERLSAELEKLGVHGWKLRASKASKCGIFGTRVDVELADHNCVHTCTGHTHTHEHRKFSDIAAIIESSSLSKSVKTRAMSIFECLANAEAKVHGTTIGDVSFHEVGAVDSIVDIVGCAVALDILGADKIVSSPVELGGGTVKCAHGILPVPAPATAIIAECFRSKINGAPHECTTPTGAAIIAACAEPLLEKISGRIIATGIGIGHRDCAELPNILRVSLFETSEFGAMREDMRELSANIDDMTPEHISFLCEKLFDAGALDAWCENIVMKKGRAAVKVCALVRVSDSRKVRETFFANSTTLGLREVSADRFSIPRKTVSRTTSFGDAVFKTCGEDGFQRVKPEFEDCKKISRDTGLPIDIVAKKLTDEFKS